MPEQPHRIAGRIGGLLSWANTPDRTVRTEPARSAGPGALEYHLAKLDPNVFANASDAQRLAAAESAKRARLRAAWHSRQAKARARTGGEAA